MLLPVELFAILSDPTRLRALMLIQAEGEACVCELTYALDESQPKISRHLALMRNAGIVTSRRQGTWMHYRIDPALPAWAREVMETAHARIKGLEPFASDLEKLDEMNNRPERACA